MLNKVFEVPSFPNTISVNYLLTSDDTPHFCSKLTRVDAPRSKTDRTRPWNAAKSSITTSQWQPVNRKWPHHSARDLWRHRSTAMLIGVIRHA